MQLCLIMYDLATAHCQPIFNTELEELDLK